MGVLSIADQVMLKERAAVAQSICWESLRSTAQHATYSSNAAVLDCDACLFFCGYPDHIVIFLFYLRCLAFRAAMLALLAVYPEP